MKRASVRFNPIQLQCGLKKPFGVESRYLIICVTRSINDFATAARNISNLVLPQMDSRSGAYLHISLRGVPMYVMFMLSPFDFPFFAFSIEDQQQPFQVDYV